MLLTVLRGTSKFLNDPSSNQESQLKNHLNSDETLNRFSCFRERKLNNALQGCVVLKTNISLLQIEKLFLIEICHQSNVSLDKEKVFKRYSLETSRRLSWEVSS